MPPRAAATANRDSGVQEGFPSPLEFLESFRTEEPPYEGLFAYFATQLELGDEASVRSYIGDRVLNSTEQAIYRDLLRNTLELRQFPVNRGVCEAYYPELDASINYLQYRLALGLMQPAVDIALAHTLPEHTRVRTHRTITATNMVRGWVLDIFGNAQNAGRAPGLMDLEVEGFLKQYFNGEYDRRDVALLDTYLDNRTALTDTSRVSDEWRRFDISDFTRRVTFSEGGTLLSGDEVDRLVARNHDNNLATGRRNGVEEPGEQALSEHEYAQVRRQITILALASTGVIPELRTLVSPRIDLGVEISAREKLLPAGRLAGRLAALEVATELAKAILQKLPRPKPAKPGEKAKSPKIKPDTKIVLQRLKAISDYYGRSGVPIDVYFQLGEEAYIRTYGEPLSHRDFSGHDDRE